MLAILKFRTVDFYGLNRHFTFFFWYVQKNN